VDPPRRAARAAPGNPAPSRGPADLRCPVEELACGPSPVEGRKKAHPASRHVTNFDELLSCSTLDSGRSACSRVQRSPPVRRRPTGTTGQRRRRHHTVVLPARGGGGGGTRVRWRRARIGLAVLAALGALTIAGQLLDPAASHHQPRRPAHRPHRRPCRSRQYPSPPRHQQPSPGRSRGPSAYPASERTAPARQRRQPAAATSGAATSRPWPWATGRSTRCCSPNPVVGPTEPPRCTGSPPRPSAVRRSCAAIGSAGHTIPSAYKTRAAM
jgi:hypothetical protein